MKEYRHIVQYYETDKMQITHHSNYIRWMEEARVDFLDQIGWNFAKLEESGIYSPVTAVECRFLKPTAFPELVDIAVSVADFNGIRLKLHYEMRNKDRVTVCEGQSEHCFTDSSGRLLSLKKSNPAIYSCILALKQEA